jgi:predicted RNase H-like nuclease
MTILAGVDGCRGGWLCISRHLGSGKTESRVYPNAQELIGQHPQPEVIAIDIPIGLSDAGQRECDQLARQLLGEPRRRSVFPAPIRPALKAQTRIEADTITRSVDGCGVGAQAWALYEKIREVDQVLRKDPTLQGIVREVHPELCFMAWNGGEAIAAGKRTLDGMTARLSLVKSHFGEEVYLMIRDKQPPAILGDDDINDAFAALWTAERIYEGTAKVIPDPPEVDSMALRMEMWY